MRKLIVIILSLVFLSAFSVDSYAQECTRNKPTISLSPATIAGPPDTTYLLTLTVRNDDTQLCDSSKFDITASLPEGWTSFIAPNSISIFPSQSETISIDVRIPKDAAKQEHQAILLVTSPNHNTPELKNSVASLITIREEPKSCTITVDEIVFRKADTDVEKIEFCLKESIDVSTKVSLRGNTQAEVFVDLLLNGKQIDSSTVNIFPDNFATINFPNTIDTETFGKSTNNVKVVAKTSCDTTEATREKQFEIDICDPSCLFTTSIAVPSQKTVGEDIIASIYVRNIGNKENLISIEPALCKGDCTPMVCEEASLTLQPDQSKSYSCRQKVNEIGTNTIETKLFSCGKEETQINDFVGISVAQQEGQEIPFASECKVQALAEYRCSGSIRQQLFRNSDCTITWVYQQYCPNGCTNALCISTGQDKSSEPLMVLEEEFELQPGKDASLVFDLENTLNSPVKFDVQVSGEASGWIHVPSSIIIGENDKEQITFSASIPEDVEAGEYSFTITTSTGSRSISKSSLIKVSKEEQQPSLPVETIVLIIGGLLAAFIILKLLQSKKSRKSSEL